MELRYRLVVVTGGGGGVGRDLSVALGRRGMSVLVADRNPAAAEATAALVRQARVPAWPIQVDLTDETEVQLLAGRARDLGGADVLVNNAGGWTEGAPGAQCPDAPVEARSRTLDLDLRTTMLLTQLFLADLPGRLVPDAPAAVVNVASGAACGGDGYGPPEHAAAKAGLLRLTSSLGRLDVAHRARVMAVVPGRVGLPRAHEQWRAMSPAEHADPPLLVPPADVCAAVLDLLADGVAGQVVELAGT